MRTALVLAALACRAGAGEPPLAKGVGLSPQGFPADYSRLGAFFEEVSQVPAGAVLWAGSWLDPAKPGAAPQGAVVVARSAAQYGYTPVFVFGWRHTRTPMIAVPGSAPNDWSNASSRALFSKTVTDFAAAYRPPLLFLGNENDLYYEEHAGDYAHWMRVYNDVYDAVKKVSPGTLAGPVFNFEHLSGSGALNGWRTPWWQALAAHDMKKVDVVGLTLYPWLSVASPTGVSRRYLDPLLDRIGGKPLAITETGWPAENPSGRQVPWETSEEAQVAYLGRLASLIEGRDVRLVDWLHLYPMAGSASAPEIWKLFSSITLRDPQGRKRPVYDRWLAFPK